VAVRGRLGDTDSPLVRRMFRQECSEPDLKSVVESAITRFDVYSRKPAEEVAPVALKTVQ
jgi:hypothetical protein